MKNATWIFVAALVAVVLAIIVALYMQATPARELPEPGAPASNAPAPAETAAPDVGKPLAEPAENKGPPVP